MKKGILIFLGLFVMLCPVSVRADSNLNGMVTENGETYYYVNGVKQTGFQKINGKIYFFSREGNNALRTGIFAIDGIYYHFDEDGVMQTGWYKENSNKYYFDENGRASGFKEIEGKKYFFSRVGDNPMRTGIFAIDGIYYHFDEDGAMQTGWYKENGNKYYYDENGRASGFKEIEGEKYFFSRVGDNPMRTGIFAVDGIYYHFDEDGAMQTGWYKENGNKYYFDENGRVSGFKEIDDKTYFFSRSGDNPMRTGVFAIDFVTYWFDKDGVMQTGWYKEDGNNKYFLNDGKMAVGSVKIGNDYYVFNEEGIMQMGWTVSDGNTYYLDLKTGKALTGLHDIDNNVYYFANDGIMQTGFQVINDKTYFFSRVDGHMRTGMFAVDGFTYYFNENGVMQTGWIDFDDGRRYFANDGVMQIGIVEIEGYKYFFNELGIQTWGFQNYMGNTYFFSRVNDHAMRIGFFQIDSKYYYFNEEGIMQNGFQVVDGITRFFSRVDGHMRTSWTLIDGHMYYFDLNSGQMAVGAKTIDNVNYIFENDGKLRDGFVTDIYGNTKYYYPDGTYANDWVYIAGTKYFFNSLGNMIGKNVRKAIDVSSHQSMIDWDRVKLEGDIDGVILRIAAGCEKEDTMLARNISELQRLGIPYGIYIYSYAENYYEGSLYANFTLKMIRKYNMNPTLGIYLDLESNNITSYMGTYEYEQVTRGFMDVMNANGYGAISKIYTYTNYAETVLNSAYLRSLITWIAQYNHNCTYNGSYSSWQYTSEGQIPGISGNVDINVWF